MNNDEEYLKNINQLVKDTVNEIMSTLEKLGYEFIFGEIDGIISKKLI